MPYIFFVQHPFFSCYFLMQFFCLLLNSPSILLHLPILDLPCQILTQALYYKLYSILGSFLLCIQTSLYFSDSAGNRGQLPPLVFNVYMLRILKLLGIVREKLSSPHCRLWRFLMQKSQKPPANTSKLLFSAPSHLANILWILIRAVKHIPNIKIIMGKCKIPTFKYEGSRTAQWKGQ